MDDQGQAMWTWKKPTICRQALALTWGAPSHEPDGLKGPIKCFSFSPFPSLARTCTPQSCFQWVAVDGCPLVATPSMFLAKAGGREATTLELLPMGGGGHGWLPIRSGFKHDSGKVSSFCLGTVPNGCPSTATHWEEIEEHHWLQGLLHPSLPPLAMCLETLPIMGVRLSRMRFSSGSEASFWVGEIVSWAVCVESTACFEGSPRDVSHFVCVMMNSDDLQ